jgi:serine/threonine protein kinase
LSGRTPFESRNIKKIDFNIMHKPIKFQNANGEFWDDISQEAKDFILACMERNPDKRPSVAKLF